MKPLQSGLQPFHSPETAMLKVINDLFTSAPCGILSILVLLDLSAAFRTMCHSNPWTELRRHHAGSDYLIWQTVHISSLCLAPLLHKGSVLGPVILSFIYSSLTYVCLWDVYWKFRSGWQTFLSSSTDWAYAPWIKKKTLCNPWDWWHAYFLFLFLFASSFLSSFIIKTFSFSSPKHWNA